jgi:uncharacterized membrane protein YozB (DUF420 family)
MGKSVDMSFISVYLVLGLAVYSVGLIAVIWLLPAPEWEAMECSTIVFYATAGLISIFLGVYFIIKAIAEAIREARRD